jgi:hypothetical protein
MLRLDSASQHFHSAQWFFFQCAEQPVVLRRDYEPVPGLLTGIVRIIIHI